MNDKEATLSLTAGQLAICITALAYIHKRESVAKGGKYAHLSLTNEEFVHLSGAFQRLARTLKDLDIDAYDLALIRAT